MSPTDSRTGFRLPWSTDSRAQTEHRDEPAPEAEHEVTAGDDVATEASVGSDPSAGTAQTGTTEPASDIAGNDRSTEELGRRPVPDASPPTAQPETEVQQVFPSVDAPAAQPTGPAPAAPTGGEPPRSHRPEKFLADLTRAMQAAAGAARDQSLGQFEADSKRLVDEIQARSSDEAAELRQGSEHDIAATREWSKAEMARIREETEARIAERRAQLDHDLEALAHLGPVGLEPPVDALDARFHERLEAYRAEMSDFFEQLLAVEDPAGFAAMAERMPEPPSLDDAWLASTTAPVGEEPAHTPSVARDDLLPGGGWDDAQPEPGTPIDPRVSLVTATADEAAQASVANDVDFDAAEAEAEAAAVSSAGLDQGDGSDEEVPDVSDSISERLAGLIMPGEAQEAAPAWSDSAESGSTRTTQVIVDGLVSVASIAGFKRQLARVPGVAAVTVSSGPEGEFVFTAAHDPSTLLAGDVAAFSGFEARVTDAGDGVLRVLARDPEA